MKYFKSFVLFFLIFTIIFLIFNSLSYFDIVGNNFIYFSNFVFVLFSALISGIYIGIKSLNKGYLEGLKIGSFIVLFMFVLSFLFTDRPFSLYLILLYILIIVFSIIGSIIGINKKKKA